MGCWYEGSTACGTTRIENAGAIASSDERGVLITDQGTSGIGSRITNSGVIEGAPEGICIDSTVNLGVFLLDSSTNTGTNIGTMTGTVDLGGGDDRFNGRTRPGAMSQAHAASAVRSSTTGLTLSANQALYDDAAGTGAGEYRGHDSLGTGRHDRGKACNIHGFDLAQQVDEPCHHVFRRRPALFGGPGKGIADNACRIQVRRHPAVAGGSNGR